MSPFSKAPFAFLLLPLIAGIFLQYYYQNIIWSIIFSLVGGLIMLLSFYWKKIQVFDYRWLFGVGTLLLFMAIGGVRTYQIQQQLNFSLPDSTRFYIGYVTETPQEKPRSIAHKVHLVAEDVNIVCYMAKDSSRLPLEVGDEIAFMADLKPFSNRGNPDDFDYKSYMYRQGFVASAYLSSASWKQTGNSHHSLLIIALKIRQQIMDAFADLGLDEEEQSVINALTLGYQDTLSDDLQQAFRTTGTVHVLSVSGLHVGIVYVVIAFLLSFIKRRSTFYRLRPLLIILLLWVYAFITGLPPSVVRASIMLSVFCLAELSGRKNNPINTLCVAGFGMLLYNPFWLFDIGFQLSFLSVLSILTLYRRMERLMDVKNKLLRYIWQMFSISLVAQLATFPLCLYYFGTFPSYFFLANLVVVPLVAFVMYGVGFIAFASLIALLLPAYAEYIYWLPVQIVHTLLTILVKFVSLFENLPGALIEGVDLSLVGLLLIYLIIVSLLFSMINSRSKSLIFSLSCIVVLLMLSITKKIQYEDNKLIVYNGNGTSDISLIVDRKEVFISDSIAELQNPVLQLNDKKILFVNSPFNRLVYSPVKYNVDYGVIIGNQYLTLDILEQYYNFTTIVLDTSLSPFVRQRLTKECEKKGICLHDVTKDGAFSIIFTTFAD